MKTAKKRKTSAQKKLADAVGKWEVEESERVEANKAKKDALDRAKARWKEEKEKAKKQGIKVKDWIITHPEPRQADRDFQPIPRKPKPTLDQFLEEEDWEDTDSEGTGDDGAGSDESEN